VSAGTGELSTVLVANRGEIARRVIRTARAMGLRTVAVYSEPDAAAPHVADADLAVPLGGSTPAESYLDLDRVLDAARRSGADALHPGYGFLAESAGFAEACAAAGLVFVGPSPGAIRRMGLKHEAKQAARTAGVPVLPDALLSTDGAEDWLLAAKTVGFPLLVKATAGGGGTGMRLVGEAGELAEAVRAARREAAGAVGDGRVFLERFLVGARHIEIQVFGDAHGNVVHLGERECSVQRRHQKVVEESPSPAVPPELRARTGAAAVDLAAALSYTGAGTVEYLLDDGAGHEPEFFFLEMNTRLQVEHPVTEEVTGYDLVRLQLKVAMGQPLAMRQEDVAPRGHAIEARLYAEDPARGFAPSFGQLWRYEHGEAAGVRYEDGVATGSEVSAFYDPMLAKVVAHADTRAEAARKLRRALAAMHLHGPATNRDFLVALLGEGDFLAGEARTDYIERHPGLLSPPPATPSVVHLAAAVAVSAHRRRAASPVAGFAPPGWRLGALRAGGTRAAWERADAGAPVEPVTVTYRLDAASGDTPMSLAVDGGQYDLALRGLGADGAAVRCDGVERYCAVHTAPDGSVWVNDADSQTAWRERPRLGRAQAEQAGGGPASEVPGTVTAVLVTPGDRVTAGQPLVVLEAMKMEHRAVAATDGVVAEVRVEVGQYVQAHEVLVTLTPPEEDA
jgi:propionyl-CoA carboxylase alpha chain